MTFKKLLWPVVCVACLIFLFSIYTTGQKKKQAPVPGNPRTITDMKGRTFEVADPLERIALLGGPTGQIAFILGVEDQLCAVTKTLKMSELVKTFFPQIADLPGPRATSGSINIEELIKADPDIAIAGDIDGGIVLEKTRIPVAFLEDSMGEGMEDIKKEVRFYGVVFNTPDRAERYVTYLERFTALVLERTRDIPENQRKKVFQGYNPSHLVTLGGDTFMQERIEIAGCLNAAQSVTTIGQRTGLHSGLGEVSMEQVLAWNPDILVINYGTPEDVYADPQWQQIRAVANRQVYPQPAGVFIFNRPTAESAALFPLWLAGIAYPEKFSDVCIPCLVKEFYGEVFDFDLSDPQASQILDGTYETRIMKGARH
ncbi:MAG: ABC transporter substrate-binding protein [Desulfotignum sp.]|nr:ABC transporter substrate-binding protein [Desulfotignum sp.]MCF8137145.1 ABC transporter substrate-binding protein [Desulfotignum sp.]